MFTGIIKGKFPVVELQDKPGLKTIVIDFQNSPPFPRGDQGGLPSFVESLQPGASVAINGVCLTVVSIENNSVRFDAMEETLRLTTIGEIQTGDLVNVERSARMGDEIGGHVMSGHISIMAEIVAIDQSENNKAMTFKVDRAWMKFLFSKGFVGLDGASLTIVNANKEEGTFQVWFIPETLRLTRFGDKQVGDHVNVEIDSQTQTIVETIERYLTEHKQYV